MTLNNDIYLSVVIPVYNEEDRIGGSLSKIFDFFAAKDYNWELICVLDGCTDMSRIVIRDICRQNEAKMKRCSFVMIENLRNFGKGYGVRQGVLASNGNRVLFTDADLSTPIEEVDKLLNCLDQGYNAVIGSRSIAGADVAVRQNVVRQSMGKTFNWFVRTLTGLNYCDTQCGFKCFDREAVSKIFQPMKVHNFCFDVEILYLAQKHGLKVKEVPIRWLNSPDSKVDMFSDSAQMFMTLFKIKRLHR